jgi:hypothetical protein
MNLLRVDFDELYRRHLRRHSQFGINVLHLISVVGVYVALFAVGCARPDGPWIVGGVMTIYFALLAINLPPLLLVIDALFVALVCALYLVLPPIPVWIYVALIPVWHRFQVWNHKVYDRQLDMSEFAGKYRKGPLLFTLLALYEAPILLRYLLFDRRRAVVLTDAIRNEAPST